MKQAIQPKSTTALETEMRHQLLREAQEACRKYHEALRVGKSEAEKQELLRKWGYAKAKMLELGL